MMHALVGRAPAGCGGRDVCGPAQSYRCSRGRESDGDLHETLSKRCEHCAIQDAKEVTGEVKHTGA